MTIHFAAARPASSRFLTGIIGPVRLGTPANDNHADTLTEAVLRASLKHFARYGLGAAENARSQAEKAFFAGDREGYDWWLGICRTLDRRLASRAANLPAFADTAPR
jgi:hypothetical protein